MSIVERPGVQVFTGPRAVAARHEHVVEFYDDDGTLIDEVCRFIGGALVAGDASIVIATPEHRAALDTCLTTRGWDVGVARRGGWYVTLDAAETLAKFMRAGQPDPRLFKEIVGGVILSTAAAARRAQVRAYGEMVAVLWARGERSAALRLEELWNDLAKEMPFSLLCGYPNAGFTNDRDGSLVAAVTALHTHAIAAAKD